MLPPPPATVLGDINSGFIACQRSCIGCLGDIGRSLVSKPLGGRMAPGPRQTAAVHFRETANIQPHRALPVLPRCAAPSCTRRTNFPFRSRLLIRGPPVRSSYVLWA